MYILLNLLSIILESSIKRAAKSIVDEPDQSPGERDFRCATPLLWPKSFFFFPLLQPFPLELAANFYEIIRHWLVNVRKRKYIFILFTNITDGPFEWKHLNTSVVYGNLVELFKGVNITIKEKVFFNVIFLLFFFLFFLLDRTIYFFK